MTEMRRDTEDKDNRFDRLAAAWDENPVRIKMTRAVAGKIRERVSLNASMNALEFGCGTGLVTVQLAPELGSICAVDSSENMLGELQRKMENEGITNVSYHKRDIAREQLPGSGYDFIFSNMTFHHIEDGDSLLEKLYKALVPGGILVLSDLDSEDGSFHGEMEGVHHQGFSRGKMVEAFERAGFRHCSVEDVHVVEKKNPAGELRRYPMFLVTGRTV